MIKFIDLFAGTGGIRLGFQMACSSLGIDAQCVFSSEIDNDACASYILNFNDNPKCDIREIDNIPEFDFLLAGFPCQAFSYAGKRKGFGDTRGTLFFEIERLLRKYKPKGFLLENVRGLVTHDNGNTFQTIVNSLNNLGYTIEYRLLNSCNFGVPQNRVRLYIVGRLKKQVHLSIESDIGPSDSHVFKQARREYLLFPEENKRYVVIRDILEQDVHDKYFCSERFVNQLKKAVGDDLSSLDGCRLIDYRGGQAIHSWDLGLKGECSSDEKLLMSLLISNRRKKIFGNLQDGKALTKEQIGSFYTKNNLSDILDSLKAKGYISCKDGRYNPVAGNMSFEVFKFLDPNSISTTLTASDTNRLGIVQNGRPRRITPREAARIQGYPDTYKLIPNDKAVYKQMGNGVSVPVIEAIITDYLRLNNIEKDI